MRCSACGYTRTRLDPLPETDCPACAVPYITSQRNVELGLVEPAREPHTPRAGGGRLRATAPLLVLLMVVAAAWHFVLRPAEAPDEIMAPAPEMGKGSIVAAASTQPQVVLFATSWCPYCAKARSFFRRHGIQYTEHDIEKDAQAYAAYSKLGGGGVPIILVGGRTVRGYNERELASLLGPWLGKGAG
jgi:glutaredoxin